MWFKNKSDTVAYIGVEKDLQTNGELKEFLDSITDKKYTVTKNKKLNNDAWTFSDNKVAKVLAKLDEQPLRVKDVFEKIFQGLKTSQDSIYILHDCKEENEIVIGFSKYLERPIEIEKGLTRKLLKGKEIHRYETLKTDKVVIFPYFKTIENGKEKVELFDEKELEKLFPKGYAYLKECENALKDRESGRFNIDGEWFQFGRKQGIIDADKEKIILSEISYGSSMTLDNNQIYHVGQYSMIKYPHIEESYKFYLAILNSKLMWFFIQQTSSILRGGYFAYRPDYMNPFPLPKIENIEDTKPFEILVDYIIFAKSQKLEDEARFFEWVVDVMVYGLYFTESMKKHDCFINDEVAKLIKPFGKHDSDEFKIEYIKTLKNVMDEEKGIKRGLLFSRNVPEVEVINGEKR